ncbi:hypothetical protein [Streptomyces nymphaeiformis]|uniref:BRCT domain-containing protein n=1 Tax=Streptomyces nymphaeiformis TaxID=2663842 RepID=A0A7W7U7Z2_9ACTN|nr:hypothetical protein [Streptomyces nymphaeiformis]MBB4986737.1 hypothetical protein [Streptomyces nymphaeiformis]
MKIPVTGETATSRAELVAREVAAGLNIMSSASRYTSALVTTDAASGSAKARRAIAEGVTVIDEHTFLKLRGGVSPGTPHENQTPKKNPEAATPPRRPLRRSRPPPRPQLPRTCRRPGDPSPSIPPSRSAVGGS